MADIESNINVNIDTSSALASIKQLQAQISAFHQSMAKSGAQANATSAQLQQQLVNAVNATGKFSATMKTVSTTTESFTTALEKNQLSMGQYFRYAGASTQTFGKLFRNEFDTIEKVARERVKTLQTQYIKLGRDANGAMQSISVRPLALDMDNLGTRTAIAAQKQQLFTQLMKQGSTEMLNFGKNTQWAGRQLMVGFTVPLTIFGATAAQEFKKLEEQMIRFKRVYGDMSTTSEATNKMITDIRSLADEYTKYGVAVEKTMGLAADAAAMGKTGADLLAQVNQASKLAVLGGVDQQQALETTTSLTNTFGIAAEDLGKKINFLNAAENQTVTSIEDLTEAIPIAAPVIQSLGGNVEDLTFLLTAMKEGGINANEGANALKSGLASMINPTQEASDALASMGINIRGIVDANAGDVKGTIIGFSQALDTLAPLQRAQAIEQLFGKFQFARMSTLFQNVTKEGSQAARVLELTRASAEELSVLSEREMKKVSDSPLYKYEQSIEKFKAALAPVGETFMKAVTPLINFGTDLLNKFNDMSEGSKNFIATLVGLFAGVGPIVLMAFGLISNGAANLIKGFLFLRSTFLGLGGESQTLGQQLNYMTQEQLEAASVASSLNQVHQNLRQTFTSEAGAVNALVVAYQKAAAAAAAIRVPMVGSAGGAVRGKKFASGGIVRGPGTGKSDSIPSMLSDGEAVIPAAAVKANPELVAALISGKVQGFSEGGVASQSGQLGPKQVNVPGSWEAAHFGGTTTMSGADLAAMAETLSPELKARVIDIVKGNLGGTFQVFTNEVVALSRELNQAVGETGSGKTADIELARKDLVTNGRAIHVELAAQLKKAGLSEQEIAQKLQLVTNEIEGGFGKLANQTTVTAEDIDGLIQDAYNKVAATDKVVDEAHRRMKDVTGVLDPSARGGKGDRLETGGSYKGKTDQYTRNLETYGPDGKSPYGKVRAFRFDAESASQYGKGVNQADLAAGYKQLPEEAKFRVGNAAVKDRIKQLQKEFDAAGIQMVEGFATSVNKASKANSPAKKAVDASGKNLVDGVLQPVEKAKPRAKAAADAIVQEITDPKKYAAEARKNAFDQAKSSGASDRDANIAANLAAQKAATEYKNQQFKQQQENERKAEADIAARKKADKDYYESQGISTSQNLPAPAAQKKVVKAPKGAPVDANGNMLRPSTIGADPVLAAITAKSKAMDSLKPGGIADKAVKALERGFGKLASSSETGAKLTDKFNRFLASRLGTEEDYLRETGQLHDTTGRMSKKKREALEAENLLTIDKYKTDQEDLKDAKKLRKQKIAQGIGVAGMIASTAVGMASMVPGQVGETAQAIAPAVMAISTIAPVLAMLPAPAAIAVGAITAVVGGFLMIKDSLDKTRETAIKTAEELGNGEKAMRKYAEFTGQVTSGEEMDQRRKDQAAGYAIQTGKSTFGQSFMQSEQGLALLESVKTAKKNGNTDVKQMITSQMMAAVSSGALNASQAKSIVANLAEQMGDYNFGIKVNGELSQLLGPNGENILTDPIGVRVKMIEESNHQIAKSDPGKQSLESGTKMFGGGALAAGGLVAGIAGITVAGPAIAAAAGAASGMAASMGAAAIAATGVAGPIGLAAVGVAALGIGIWQAVDGAQKLEKAAAANVALGVMALQNNQEILDSLQLEYEKKIEIAKAAGDQAEAERLTSELLEGRKAVLEANALTMTQMTDQYSRADPFAKGAMGRSLDTAIENTYKDNPLAQQAAIGARDAIVSNTADTEAGNRNEYQLKLMLATGDVDPGLLLSVVNTITDEKDMTAMVNFMTNLGSAEGARLVSVMGSFMNPDGTADVEATKTFTANFVTGKTPEETAKYLDLFQEIGKGETAGIQVQAALSFYNENPDEAEKAADDLATLREEAKKGQISVDYVMNLYGENIGKAIQANQAYWDSLPPDQQVVYTTVLRTVELGVGKKGDKTEDRAAYVNWAKSKDYGVKEWNTRAVEQEYMNEKATQVTQANMAAQANAGPAAPGPTDTGGGGGAAKDPYESILKALKNVRDASIDARGGVAELMRLLGSGQDLIGGYFGGVEQQLLKLGGSKEFINMLSSAESEAQALWMTIENGTVVLTAAGAALRDAFDKKIMGDFQNQTQQSIAGITNQISAIGRLKNAGLSAKDAAAMANDVELAGAIARAKNVAEINNLIAAYQKLKQVQEQLALQTPEGIQAKFDEGFNKAMEAFQAKEQAIEIQFKIDTKADSGIVREAENQIAAIQYQIDDYNASLHEIELKEQDINKAYDEKVKALEQVKKINQDIINQQKAQLGIADALTSGDMAAAARAVQDSRGQNAMAALDAQGNTLTAARQAAIDNTRASNGTSRIQNETTIRDLQEQIFRIEESQLEPARERIRLAEIKKQKDIESLTVAGKTRDEWTEIKNKTDLAKTSSGEYTTAIQASANMVQTVVDNWAKVPAKVTTVYEIQQVFTGGAGDSGAAGDGQGGGNNGYVAPSDEPTPAPTGTPPSTPSKAPINDSNDFAAMEARWKKYTAKNPAGSAGRDWMNRRWNAMHTAYTTGASTAQKRRYAQELRDGLAQYGFNLGGQVPGSGNTDKVSARLTPGEFVVNKAATKKNMALLRAINGGAVGGSRYKASTIGTAEEMFHEYKRQAAARSVEMQHAYETAAKTYAPRDFNQTLATPQQTYNKFDGNTPLYNNDASQQVATSNDNSVYNYNLSVNVDGTNASADQIASTVIAKLKTLGSQQIKRQAIK